ncbi:MAG: arylesterase [Planctomycetota bacterium]|nr:MAG: arylesterase [Planctomycetota bacterium]
MAKILILFFLILSSFSCGTDVHRKQISKKLIIKKSVNPIRKFLFIGDSLTAGYGVYEQDCFVSIITKQFRINNINIRVVNAGISGEMSIGTLSRIKWLIDEKVETVFLCIGGNDGLRGKSLVELQKNIESIIKIFKNKNIKVILAGMQIPPNYSKEYTMNFKILYSVIAKNFELKLLPFLLEGVAGVPAFNQVDGVHPNKKGHQKIANHILSFLRDEKIYLK